MQHIPNPPALKNYLKIAFWRFLPVQMFLLFFSNLLFAQGGTYCDTPYDYAVNNQSASSIFPGGGGLGHPGV
ncbi:MAG: hypothetical protein R3D58_01195 [Saprospiraceae bacterium]